MRRSLLAIALSFVECAPATTPPGAAETATPAVAPGSAAPSASAPGAPAPSASAIGAPQATGIPAVPAQPAAPNVPGAAGPTLVTDNEMPLPPKDELRQ